MSVGYVYVLTHVRMPGLVKIGCTSSGVEQRIQELCSTGVPGRFECAYECIVKNPRDIEQATHQLLSERRVSSGREFFECTPAEAVKAILEVCRGAIIEETDHLLAAEEVRRRMAAEEERRLAAEEVENWRPLKKWPSHVGNRAMAIKRLREEQALIAARLNDSQKDDND